MSTSVTIPEFVAYSFRRWALEQQGFHADAAKAATASIEAQILMPIDATAARLVHAWKTAIGHSKLDKVDDVNVSLLDSDIVSLLSYIQRCNASTSSHVDASHFSDAWLYYQTQCAQKCKKKFKENHSSNPDCVKQFFECITLRNMFDVLKESIDTDKYADTHEDGYHIFWAMRSMCGIVDADDPLVSQRYKKRKLVSAAQTNLIRDASQVDDMWAYEYDNVATSFGTYCTDTKNIVMKAGIAERQAAIGVQFQRVLKQLSVINTRSINDHDAAYGAMCRTVFARCKALLVVHIEASLGLILRFIDMPHTNIRAITAYIAHAVSNAPKPACMLPLQSIAYAKRIQECELGVYSKHVLEYTHESLMLITNMIGGLFPVPPCLPVEFTTVLNDTIALHTSVSSLDDTVEARICSLSAVDDCISADRAAMCGRFMNDAVSTDGNMFIQRVYADMTLCIESNEPVASVRNLVARCMADVSCDEYTFEPCHIAASTKLLAFELDAITQLQLALTSNADIVSQKRLLSHQMDKAYQLWVDASIGWSKTAQSVVPPFVVNPFNLRLTDTMIMNDKLMCSLHRHILVSKIQAYVEECISVHASLKAAGDADHEAFGVQASILSDTFGSKYTKGHTFGHVMRAIEIIVITTTQALVNQELENTISKYKPSIEM